MPKRIITNVKLSTTFTGRRLRCFNVFSGEVVIGTIRKNDGKWEVCEGRLNDDELDIAVAMTMTV